MSIQKTKEELERHKANALSKLDSFLSSLINSDDLKSRGKSDKLSYWLEDWTTFLSYEPNFSPLSIRRYKRGEIIKVHLGFNIGSEEGGLHYAVVLDNNNAKSSPVITIVPLTSVKPHTDLSRLKSGSIFLGNELFTSLNAKVAATRKHIASEIDLMKEMLENFEGTELPKDTTDILKEKIKEAQSEIDFLERMRAEVIKMKNGSIALVNQITTISKIRIYDPKTDHDILSNIKLSNENLDKIDKEILKKFTKTQHISVDNSIK